MSQNLEFLDAHDSVVEKLRQSLNNRLDFPPTKIPERYTRLQGTVALKLICDLGGIKFRMLPLISFDDGLHLGREKSSAGPNTNNKFLVLINNIEVVDDTQRVVKRIGGVIRLKSFDQATCVGVCNSLYFSFKSFNVSFLDGPFLKDREVYGHVVLLGTGRETPNDMVEAR